VKKKPNKKAVKRWLNTRVLDPALDFEVSKVTKVSKVHRIGSCLAVEANVAVKGENLTTGLRVLACRGRPPRIDLGPRFR
jgi:hypothetical protein